VSLRPQWGGSSRLPAGQAHPGKSSSSRAGDAPTRASSAACGPAWLRPSSGAACAKDLERGLVGRDGCRVRRGQARAGRSSPRRSSRADARASTTTSRPYARTTRARTMVQDRLVLPHEHPKAILLSSDARASHDSCHRLTTGATHECSGALPSTRQSVGASTRVRETTAGLRSTLT
jgi:hypothetical protein